MPPGCTEPKGGACGGALCTGSQTVEDGLCEEYRLRQCKMQEYTHRGAARKEPMRWEGTGLAEGSCMDLRLLFLLLFYFHPVLSSPAGSPAMAAESGDNGY